MTDIARTCPICNTSFTGPAGKKFDKRECQLKARALPEVAPTKVHVFIPDTQVKPGVRTDHLEWIGTYISDQWSGKDNIELTLIHGGDHWDFESLSPYDKGKLAGEGRRYKADVDAGNAGFHRLHDPCAHVPAKRKFKLGNHEDRVRRVVEDEPRMEGHVTLDDLDTCGWEVAPFLEPEEIDGVHYAHYFYNPMSGKPYGGVAATRLKTIGHSFTMGHQQTLDYALRFVGGRSQHALIAGACYLHDEDYKGPQGNAHWRGIVVCHNVENGSYDPMFVSLDYLARRYEGLRLNDFLARAA